ncbi:MAG: hypothetical protein ABI634_12965 [Acidobacteriota bacterium]
MDVVPAAEIRPAVRPPDAVQVTDVSVAGETRRSLSVIVPSRVIIRERVPLRAVFTTALAVDDRAGHEAGAGIAFSLGISDGRIYEPLLQRTILAGESASWQPVRVDLRHYAGWQWSLFYRPSAITWQFVLNSYPAGPGSERLRGIWARPAIDGAVQ